MIEEKIKDFFNLFEGKKIRCIFDVEKHKIYFSVLDLISSLKDNDIAYDYWKCLKYILEVEQNVIINNIVVFDLYNEKDELEESELLDKDNICKLIRFIKSISK